MPQHTTPQASGRTSSYDHWNSCGETNVPESGTATLTQDGTSFRISYRGVKEGGVSSDNYICQVSYPEDNGTTIESMVFTLTSPTEGSGFLVWYWSNGSEGCWGGNEFTLSKTGVINERPNAPDQLSPPENASNVSLTPTLMTGPFSDPDGADTHLKTEWQISLTSGYLSTVLSTITEARLTALTVPQFVLKPGTTYYWRVRYYDNHGTASPWSSVRAFSTVTSSIDPDGNGIPDDQEVDSGVDLDGDGNADNDQPDIKSLNTVVGNCQMGISRKVDPRVVKIGSIQSIDPAVETPEFSPSPGTYTVPQNISLSCATEYATICYTTDGRDPTEMSTEYLLPFEVTVTTTVKARGYKSEMEPSQVASGAYIFPGTMGDLNGNGPADLGDAVLILRILCGLEIGLSPDIVNAGVNGDGVIGLAEGMFILQAVSGSRN